MSTVFTLHATVHGSEASTRLGSCCILLHQKEASTDATEHAYRFGNGVPTRASSAKKFISLRWYGDCRGLSEDGQTTIHFVPLVKVRGIRDRSARDATAREAKALQLGEGESADGRQWIRRSRRVLVAGVSAVAPAAPARSCLARSVVVPAAAGGANPAVSILISSTCTCVGLSESGVKGWMAPSPQGWFAGLKPRRPGSLSTRRNPR
jgi:hypothetical protein